MRRMWTLSGEYVYGGRRCMRKLCMRVLGGALGGDGCCMRAGGIMSYALDSKASQDAKRSADFNHFVVFDPYQVIACHDFEVCSAVPADFRHVPA